MLVANAIRRLEIAPRSPISASSVATDKNSPPSQPTRILRRSTSKRTFKHLHEIAEAIREIARLPARDEALHCIMGGNFHAWDLVPAILQLAAPSTIASLHVSTLGFNTRNAGELLRLLDEGKVGAVAFLCSHYFSKSCLAEFEMLRTGLSERGQRIAAIRTHAKVIAARLSDGRAIVVESSANLRSCNNIEQFTMTESIDLYDFHARWIDKGIEQCLASPEPPERPSARRR